MNNEVIYRGLRLRTTKCRYFQVNEGSTNSIVEDTKTSCLTLTYVAGSTAKSLSVALGIPTVGNDGLEMEPTGSIADKFKTTTVTLNGFKLRRLTRDSHVINIVIVSDSESRVVQSYSRTVIVVNVKDYKDPKFINFLFYSGNLLFLQPVGKMPVGYEIRNFPKIIIDYDIDLDSNSETVYTLRKRYNDYVIREVDYQDQFILEMRRILDDYGVELVRLNKEVSLVKTSYITYQFNQTPILYSHPKRRDTENGIISHRQGVDFTLHTPDMVLFHDFKNKYSNVDLLTNLVEFKTTDRYGERWTAAVKWFNLTDNFENGNSYQQDDSANFAHQCQFRCELNFYEVKDSRYEFLKEINLELDSEDISGKNKVEDNQILKSK
jgi:hypothetical protein